MTKRFHVAFAATLSLLVAAQAFAADNYQVKDANGTTITIRSKDTGAGQSPQFVPSDAAGAPVTGPAGTPSSGALTVQGISGGTPQAADTVVRSTSVDRGGTITAGGSAQQFMPANANRRGFLMQNQSTADLYVNCVATAAANQSSLRIPAGALYESSPHHSGTGACSVIGATSGQAFYAREF